MKLLATAGIVTVAALASAPVAAATVVVTDQGTSPSSVPLTLIPLGNSTYTAGSTDQIVSSGTALRNFSVNYVFSAPQNGSGSISFTTTSVNPGSALLSVTSATFNGAPVTIDEVTSTTGARTFNGTFAFANATLGDPFQLTLNGTVRRGGTLSTSVSFAAGGVPEPATWGMMIVGLGAVGGTMRRRRQAVRVRFA